MTSKEFRRLSAAARRQYFRQYRAAWAQAKKCCTNQRTI